MVSNPPFVWWWIISYLRHHEATPWCCRVPTEILVASSLSRSSKRHLAPRHTRAPPSSSLAGHFPRHPRVHELHCHHMPSSIMCLTLSIITNFRSSFLIMVQIFPCKKRLTFKVVVGWNYIIQQLLNQVLIGWFTAVIVIVLHLKQPESESGLMLFFGAPISWWFDNPHCEANIAKPL